MKVRNGIRSLALCAIATAVAVASRAETLSSSLIQSSGDPAVAAGKFYGYRTKTEGPGDDALEKAQALAEEKNVPLVVVWSEEQCPHCNSLITQMNAAAADVTSFLSTNRAVFTFFKADTADDGVPSPSYKPKVVYDAYRFATATCKGGVPFPIFGFYYKKADGTVATGGTQYGTYEGREWPDFKSLYLKWLADSGVRFDYLGGEFAASDTAFDRYEAEATTRWVDVELVRDEADAVGGVPSALVVTWPDGTASTNAHEWAKGETAAAVRVEIPEGKFAVGERAALSLCGDDGAVHSTNSIHFVEKKNTNGNPLWIGERTADSLAFGEWTMDLTVATNKVAAFGGSAYTLVSIQGSLWCPDCGNVDRNFMDLEDGKGDNRFRAWAASNNVALVAVDIPNYNGPAITNCATPSLLSRDAYATAIARAREWPASGADPALTNLIRRSGRAYLSRKMVSEDDALAFRERNHFLVSTNTPFGGFHRPEDGNKNRTGVPIFVLLRKDGTVAARMTRFASVSPMAEDREKWDDFIKRFDEMIEIASSDASEIENNHWTTTAETLTNAIPVSASVSHCDTADWYELVGVRARSVVRLGLSSSGSNVVTLAIAVAKGDSFKTVASAKGPVDGLSVMAELPVGTRWFAGVTCANTTEGFEVGSESSTFAGYSLSAEIFPPEQGPGRIAFESDNTRALEFAGTGVVQVVRSNGSLGAASVRVLLRSCDETATNRLVWTDQVLSWEDGESGAKEVGFGLLPNEEYEGDGVFSLGLEKIVGEAIVESSAACAVTIVDTDAPCMERSRYEVSAYAAFAAEARFSLLNVQPGDTQVTVSRASSSAALPAGMKVSYDRNTGEIVLSGVPKKAGTYTFACTVSARRGGRKLTGFETTLTIVVADPAETNPLVAVKRPAQLIPLYAVDSVGRRFAAGTVNVAVTSAGAISAKYSGTEGKSVSFSGRWSDLDVDDAAYAELSAKGATLSLSMDVEGRMSVLLSLPEGYSYFNDGYYFEAFAGWPQTGVFDAFKGYYTAAMPQVGVASATNVPTGGAFLTLNMTSAAAVRNGTVRFAGILPDGTSVSGSTTISRVLEIPDYDFCAEVPVFARTSRNVFGAVMTIDASGADKWDSAEGFRDASGDEWLKREVVRGAPDAESYVLHREAALSYETHHEVYGSYYVPGVSPAHLDSFYEAASGYEPGAPFTLAFDTSMAADSERYGAILALPELAVRAGAKTLVLDRTAGFSFGFNSRTGVFSGSARFSFDGGRRVVGTFRGVLAPGWVLPCNCGLSAPERPFGHGVLVFRDIVSGRSAVRSVPAILDKIKNP